MVITCPSCASTHTVDATRIGASGRKVRCAACRESWFISAVPVEIETIGQPDEVSPHPLPAPASSVAPTVPAPRILSAAPIEPPAGTRSRRPTSSTTKKPRPMDAARTRRFATAAAVLILAVAPALVATRNPVVGLFPGTATLFSALGLPVNRVGLRFESVTSTLSAEAGPSVLEIAGTISNVGSDLREVPPVEIEITGAEGEQLYRWSVKAAEGALKPGASMPFGARLASPPPAGRRIALTFGVKSSSQTVALR